MIRLVRPALVTLALSATALTPLALPAQEVIEAPAGLTAPVRSVILSNAGVAQFVRALDAGDGVSTHVLTVDLDEVDDLLKSLALSGDGVVAARIRLAGADPAGDVFSRLPFDPAQLGNLEALLSAYPGALVNATSINGPVTGRILGVSAGTGCAEGVPCPALLLLATGAGEVLRVPLNPETRVTFVEQSVQDQIARGLESLADAAQDRVRTLTIEIERQGGSGPIYLTHVAAAPVWKTSWRAEISPEGGVAVQGWAVIENATGESWSEVDFALSVGAPRLLHQALHARVWGMREELPVLVAEPMTVRERFAMEDGVMAEMAPAPMAAAPLSMSPGMAQLDTGNTVSEADVDARFDFAMPVSLGAGQMISLPFLSDEIEARRVIHFTGGGVQGQTRHPAFVLDLHNTLDVRMPDGIVTVHEAGRGHLGDAAIENLGPGERALVAFATDRKTDVMETWGSVERRETIVLRDGLIVFQGTESRRVVYAAEAPEDGDRLLLIDHPLSHGWTVTAEGPAAEWRVEEDVPQGVARFEVPLEAGAGVTLALNESRPVSYVYGLADARMPDLVVWAEGEMSAEDREVLEGLIGLRRQEDGLRVDLGMAQNRRTLALQQQERTRQNLAAVPDGSDAHQRYLTQLLALEDEIDAAEAEVGRLEAELADLRRAVADLIGKV